MVAHARKLVVGEPGPKELATGRADACASLSDTWGEHRRCREDDRATRLEGSRRHRIRGETSR